jgi:hypothetical protein
LLLGSDGVVSLHERYSICRRNCGFPIPNTILITYSHDALPSTAQLLGRIKDLLSRIPLLSAEVRESRTRTPYFSPKSWTSQDFLHEEQIDGLDRDEVLRLGIRRIEEEDEDKRLWHVIRYTSQSGNAYLAISAQHELMDGQGLMRLAQAITAHDISDIPTEVFDTKVGMAGPDYQPSISFLLPIIYREKIIPLLPTWISSYLRPPTWPTTIDKHPSTAPWDFSILSLPPQTIKDVSRKGKEEGVTTLHPILKVAYLQAMREIYGPASPDAVFIGESPRSERSDDPTNGYSYLAGNYVSGSSWTLPQSGEFGEWCQSYSTYLRTIGISEGRQAIGLLSYLPDPPSFYSDDKRRATGWEDEYLTKFEAGHNTYSQSLSFSNLGRISLERMGGAEDLVWGFPGSPFAPPLSVALVGHEGGLRVYSTWRVGCPVTRESAGEVEVAFKRILEEQGK